MKSPHVIQRLITRLNLIPLSVKFDFPGLTAFLALLVSKSLAVGSQKTVLCLGRPIFNEDIRELAKYGTSLNYLIMSKLVFISIFDKFLSGIPLYESHIRYHEISGFEEEKRVYRKYLRSFLKRLIRMQKIDAVFSANYVYAWQQELAIVCREENIPFVILFKEGISPMYRKGVPSGEAHNLLVAAYTNKVFIGDKLLVYNENMRRAFVTQKIDGISPSMVVTVGIPRFDRYFQLKSSGKSILFFSFYLEDKIRHLNLPENTLKEHLNRGKEFHKQVIKYAAFHPDTQVVIKTKRNFRYMEYVRQIAAENGWADLENITLTNKGDVYRHIKRSFAVIGYNSTVLLEGFAARRLIITPDFREGEIHDFFDQYPRLANYVKTMEDIERVLSQETPVPLDDVDLKSLLQERVYIPDGQACKRAEAAILNVMDVAKASNTQN